MAPRLAFLAVEALCGAAVLAAALALPWAEYHVRGSPVVPLHVEGTLAVALVTIAALSIVVAALQIRWSRTALAGAEMVLGPVTLVLCAVAAAGRISHANSVPKSAASTTAYAVGAGVAVAAGVVLVCAAIVVLVLNSQPGAESPVTEDVTV